MDNRNENYKRAVKLIQIFTKRSMLIHLFCGIGAALLLAKDLFWDKSFDVLKEIPIAAVIWIALFLAARISYKRYFEWPVLFIGQFILMLTVYIATVFILFTSLFLDSPPNGAIFLLAISSALTETPYKNETL